MNLSTLHLDSEFQYISHYGKERTSLWVGSISMPIHPVQYLV
jgi:hypothetical protein